MKKRETKKKCSGLIRRLTGKRLRTLVILAGFPYHKNPHLYQWLWVFILLPFLEEDTLNELAENHGNELRKLFRIINKYPGAFEKLFKLIARPLFFELLDDFDLKNDTDQSRTWIKILIDDTKSEKFGKTMEFIHKLFDHGKDRYIMGYNYVLVLVVSGDMVFPLTFILWLPETLGFKLSQQSLDELEAKGVPAEIIAKLQELKSQRFKTKEEFINALEKVLEIEQTDLDKPLIEKLENQEYETKEEFINVLENILKSDQPVLYRAVARALGKKDYKTKGEFIAVLKQTQMAFFERLILRQAAIKNPDYHSKNDLIRDFIKNLHADCQKRNYSLKDVEIMFDSAYCVQKVMNEAIVADFRAFSKPDNNHKFEFEGESLRPREIIEKVKKRLWEKIDKNRFYQRFKVDHHLYGTVVLVVRKRILKNGKIIYDVLICNKELYTGRRIDKKYRERWEIEMHFKYYKQYLGLGKSQFRKLGSIKSHLYSVALAGLVVALYREQSDQKISFRKAVKLIAQELRKT